MNRFILSTACLLIALGGIASGQAPSAKKSVTPQPEAQPQPQPQPQQKIKQGRHRVLPRPILRGSNKRVPANNQNQAAVANPKAKAETGNASANNVRLSYADALRRYRHERHDRAWWKQHYTVIVLVLGGYYYWDAGYWCPAWGYDLSNEYYDYDGPIYTYGNLLPDQVIANVQRALKELGYYAGGISGALSPATRAAITAYQEDNGLEATGAIDAVTVGALGLN